MDISLLNSGSFSEKGGIVPAHISRSHVSKIDINSEKDTRGNE